MTRPAPAREKQLTVAARAHVAIVQPLYLEMILQGLKQAEARLSKTRRLPYKGLDAGDVIYFKATGGAIGARAVASRVHRFELAGPGDVQTVRSRFEGVLGGPSPYWDCKADARYATIIELGGVEAVSEPPAWFRPMPSRSAWHVFEIGARA